jgi:hypothetical protein
MALGKFAGAHRPADCRAADADFARKRLLCRIRVGRHLPLDKRHVACFLLAGGSLRAPTGAPISSHIRVSIAASPARGGGYGMARRSPPRKVTYFEPVPPRLARNTIIESTFEVGRRFRCTMRVDCGQLDPRGVIRPIRGEWHPHMPDRLDEEELANWRAGRDAVYQLAAHTIGARLAVAEG